MIKYAEAVDFKIGTKLICTGFGDHGHDKRGLLNEVIEIKTLFVDSDVTRSYELARFSRVSGRTNTNFLASRQSYILYDELSEEELFAYHIGGLDTILGDIK